MKCIRVIGMCLSTFGAFCFWMSTILIAIKLTKPDEHFTYYALFHIIINLIGLYWHVDKYVKFRDKKL